MAIIDKIKLSGQTFEIQDSNASKTVELTQAEYDALATKDPNTYYIITDATPIDITNYYTKTQTDDLLDDKLDVTAYTPTDLSNYYTKSETSGATQIQTALNGKADNSTVNSLNNVVTAHTADTTVHVTANEKSTWNNKSDFSGDYNDLTNKLSAGTNITIVDNVISAEGGGKAIEAGRGISITTGETADTVSFNLPISAGTGEASAVFGKDYGSDMFLSAYTPYVSSKNSFAFGSASIVISENSFATGYLVKVKGQAGTSSNFAQGYMTTASGNRCHSEGLSTSATSDASHSEGHNTVASGNYSHSEGEEVKATNVAEHSQGRYNVSNKANTTFGDSGNTLFSVGNGTSNSARHNAFEIRQNGDIYLTLDGQDVKLQDQLGGGGSSYTAGDGIDITNDVISVTGKVDTSTYNTYTAATDTALASKADTATTYTKTEVDTALASKQTTLTAGTNITIVDNVISAEGGSDINVVQTTGTSTTDVMSQDAATSNFIYKINLKYKVNGRDTLALQSKGKNLFIPYMTINGEKVLSTNDLSVIETSAITTSVTSSSTDAQVPSAKAVNDKLGGLSLVKLTQAEYDALVTKDSNTLYVING